jgi:phage terminase large subunit-like protein
VKTTANKLSDVRQERKELAESDLEEFIKLVHPRRLLGNIHREVIQWWTRQQAHNHQLLLLPRDHMKSALVAYRAVWEVTRNPAIRILFISSTSNLATKQLKFIKDILTSDTYRIYWPEMVHPEEAKREKWTEREISIDHPIRKYEAIRDPTIFTAGLTSNIVGMHCDIAILDDVVVQANAYQEENREKVKEQYSLLSSIETVDAKEWVVGTRYHPNDLYNNLLEMEVEQFDETGNVVQTEPLFEVLERQVESVGDGTGEFLWPRQQRSDGKWFGFDQKILANKRAQYLNKVHFRAQYYNDPHSVEDSPITRSNFQYYDKQWLNCINGKWYFRKDRLNVCAAIDFAFSITKKADYSCIVVIGLDGSGNYYILDIDRFKTDKISDYFDRILRTHQTWGYNKIRCEMTVAQAVIVKDLKENYIKRHGLALSIDEFRPSKVQGSKEERIMAALQPKYNNKQMWHYQGGNCQTLEEELLYVNPQHDDIKDCLASAVDLAIGPVNYFHLAKKATPTFNYHERFGGVL